jgi:hypothetical protein
MFFKKKLMNLSKIIYNMNQFKYVIDTVSREYLQV